MRRLLLLLAVLTASGGASAQIATYTFEGTRAPAPTTVGAGATAAAAVYGPGLSTPVYVPGATGTATSAQGYESAGNVNRAVRSDYLDITVTAASGRVLAPATFTFAVRSGANGPKDLFVRTSADGFATNVGNLASPTLGYTAYSVDLAAPAFQNRPTLSVRIYGHKAGNGVATMDIDDVVLNGSTLVPVTEVATLGFNPTSTQVLESGTATATVRLGIMNDTGAAGLNAAVSATVTFDVDGSTAVAADLGAITGTVTFAVGSPTGTTRTVSIPTVDDTVFEGTENAQFALPSVTGGSASGALSVNITDNDPAPAIVVTEIDPTATGNAEFVELLGPAATSMTPFTLVFYDAATSASYRTVNLTGAVLSAAGRLVIGNAGVPGVSGLVLPAGAIVDAGGAVALYQDAAALFPDGTVATGVNLVSALAYGQLGTVDRGFLDLLGLFVQHAEAYENNAAGMSLSRLANATAPGSTRLAYAVAPTPGAANPATVTVDRTADLTVRDGYRLFSAPLLKPGGTQPFNVHDLATMNLVQRVTGGTDAGGTYPQQYPTAPGPNLYLGYTGTAYTPATTTADDLVPGAGFFWRLYNLDRVPAATGPFGPGSSVSYTITNPSFRLRMTGVPQDNNSMATTDVAFTQTADGFYMIGNPFAYPLQLSGISTSSGSFQTTFQAFNGTTYVPVLAGPGSVIAPWQGVFAEASATPPTGAFSVRYDSRTVLPAARGTALVGRGMATEAAQGIDVVLAGTTVSGAVVEDLAAFLRLSADASDGWDAGDASKLTPPTATHALIAFTGTRGDEAIRQAVRSAPLSGGTFPMAFATTAAGTFSLTAGTLGLPEGWTATVRDLVTGQVADLADGLRFTADATGWTERFELTVEAGGATAAEAPAPAAFTLSAPSPNPTRGATQMRLRLPAPEHVRASVYDALGRHLELIYEGEASDVTLVFESAHVAPGVYVVRVQGATFADTRRLTVVR